MMPLTILIVDDEPLMRLSIVDALEAVGHDVCAAATGTEGIEEARRREYDLVITDLRLPGADGLAVLKAAKEARAQTEVVVITAHGSVETAVGAMKLGAFDYITKPFKMDELLLVKTLSEETREGDFADGYRWRYRIEEAASDSQMNMDGVATFTITVWVSWEQGQKTKNMDISALTVAKLPNI